MDMEFAQYQSKSDRRAEGITIQISVHGYEHILTILSELVNDGVEGGSEMSQGQSKVRMIQLFQIYTSCFRCLKSAALMTCLKGLPLEMPQWTPYQIHIPMFK